MGEAAVLMMIAVTKNNTLYIDGGRQTFATVVNGSTPMGNITTGYSMLSFILEPFTTDHGRKTTTSLLLILANPGIG